MYIVLLCRLEDSIDVLLLTGIRESVVSTEGSPVSPAGTIRFGNATAGRGSAYSSVYDLVTKIALGLSSLFNFSSNRLG